MRASSDGTAMPAGSLGTLLAQLARLDTELLELAVQVGPLQARLFGHARHRAAFLGQVELEIAFLELAHGEASVRDGDGVECFRGDCQRLSVGG